MNAAQTVAAVQRATVLVAQWDQRTAGQVAAAMPEVCTQHRVTERDWAVTVECLRRDWETPAAAAERIGLYMTLHAERWGETPTLNTVRKSLLEDR